jgi:hypothetical protein
MDQGIDDDFSVSNRAALVQVYPLFNPLEMAELPTAMILMSKLVDSQSIFQKSFFSREIFCLLTKAQITVRI